MRLSYWIAFAILAAVAGWVLSGQLGQRDSDVIGVETTAAVCGLAIATLLSLIVMPYLLMLHANLGAWWERRAIEAEPATAAPGPQPASGAGPASPGPVPAEFSRE